MSDKKDNSKELEPYEIVAKSVRPGQDPNQIYAAIIKMTQQPNYRVIRHNNTLLMIDNKGSGVADGTIYSADSDSKMLENITQFAKALKVGKFNKLTIVIPNLKFIEFFKKSKLNYSVQNRGINTFLVTVTL